MLIVEHHTGARSMLGWDVAPHLSQVQLMQALIVRWTELLTVKLTNCVRHQEDTSICLLVVSFFCRMTDPIEDDGPGSFFLEVVKKDNLPILTEKVALVSGRVYAARQESKRPTVSINLGAVERCEA